jgi:trimeric autotransporter adhesin
MVTAEAAADAVPGSYTATITGSDAATGTLTASTTLTITVTGGSPAIALSNSGNLSIAAGATTGNSASITISPSNGFSGQVNLSCSVSTSMSNPTDPPGCTIPASVTISGTTAATANVTVTTTAPSSTTAFAPMLFGGGATLAMVLFFGVPARRRAWRGMLATTLKATLGVMAAVLVVSGIGCGSAVHPTTSSGTGSLSPGTTPGAYVVTISAADAATGNIKATTTVNVTVN